jgi:hypothetical protein
MPDGMVRGERLQVLLSPEELKALDDFRFRYRMPSRAATIRELLKRGLTTQGSKIVTRAKSSDFGVLTNAQIQSRESDKNE